MDVNRIQQLLTEVQAGQVSVAQALEQLRRLPYDDLGHTRLDMHRALRQGLPEVVFCENKTTEQVVDILQRLGQHHDRVLATRVSADKAQVIQAKIPNTHYDATSRLVTLAHRELDPLPHDAPYLLVATGGTSDLPVAEEAAQTAEFLGSRVKRAYDVGVAGVHRLLDQRDLLFDADVVISVAGMEGALTSVVGGLVACPVIGVPTSVGYGASFNGLAALLSMLNSCASGVAVVNIDNGFGAGLYAHLILRRIQGKDLK
ncbi:MAG: nickel pincer cofactor biosynthesis protein LarB [Anaerolineae bacterium]|nr:nickel pincer cofactor biosynthesis protein LarB [Anaerolineae bacterium]